MYYGAYGSNMNLNQMKHRCPGAIPLSRGRIFNYRLTFRGRKGMAVATIEPEDGTDVPIAIWKINKQNEKSLDSYEGFPTLYRKEYFTIDIDGKRQQMLVYVMNETYDYNLPSRWYFDTILQGYKDFGIKPDPLRKAARDILKSSIREKGEREA